MVFACASALAVLAGCGDDDGAAPVVPTPVVGASSGEGPGALLDPAELDAVCFEALIALEVEANRDQYMALDDDGRRSFEGIRVEALEEMSAVLTGRVPADVSEAMDLIISHPITSDQPYDTDEHRQAVEFVRAYLGLSCPLAG